MGSSLPGDPESPLGIEVVKSPSGESPLCGKGADEDAPDNKRIATLIGRYSIPMKR